MKKVIGAVLAASLVAGMAFADVAVTLSNIERANLYHQTKTAADKTTTNLFDLNGASGHGGTADGNKGVLGFKASNDNSGVVLDVKVDRKGNAIGFDGAYYGYMSFGALKLTFGTFDSRFVTRGNVSAGEEGLLGVGDTTKYGTGLLNGFAKKTVTLTTGTDEVTYKTTLLKDANNATAIAGDKSVSLVADYTIDDVAGGYLLLKAGLLTSEFKSPDANDTSDSKSYQKAGYVAEVDFDNDAVKLQALVKMPNEKQTVFGIFAEPKVMEELPLAFGFAYGKDSDGDNKYHGKLSYTDNDAAKTAKTTDNDIGKITAMAFDARVGYIISDQLRVDSAVKYETVEPDGGKKASALSVAGEVSYVVNDLATVFGDIGYYNYNLSGEDAYAKMSRVSVRPGVKLTAGKAASITAALQYDSWSGDGKAKKSEMSIPVFFKVAL